MEKFEISILGCGCAVPTMRHNPAAQIVNFRHKLFMIDCGEGTQLQYRRRRLPFARLQAVFISHLHGDHCLGLVGMISTFALLGRTAPLHVYAPAEFEPILQDQIDFFVGKSAFEVPFHPIDTKQTQVIYEDRGLTVTSLPLLHRVPCCGFLFREKASLPHIKREMIDFYKIPHYAINSIKQGADWTTPEGDIIPNHRLVFAGDAPRSYAYCSDTAYCPSLCETLKGINLLYHEATFAEDMAERARLVGHSTARQAAQIARAAEVGKLLLGHFSARYEDETVLLQEAQMVFPNAILAHEGLCISL